MTDERPFYVPGHRGTSATRVPKPAESVWGLRQGDRTQTCEFRNDARAGYGWDVQVLEDGELLFSRRCANEEGARFVAASFREDAERAGWTE